VREILLVLVQHAAPDNALVLLTIHRLTKEGWCTLCHSGSTTSMKQRPSQTPPPEQGTKKISFIGTMISSSFDKIFHGS
jgi:hypothetical protein